MHKDLSNKTLIPGFVGTFKPNLPWSILSPQVTAHDLDQLDLQGPGSIPPADEGRSHGHGRFIMTMLIFSAHARSEQLYAT